MASEPAGRMTDGAGDPNCPICHGVGYVREDRPVGHPQFGKLQICTCQLENLQLQRAAQMRLGFRLEREARCKGIQQGCSGGSAVGGGGKHAVRRWNYLATGIFPTK